MAGPSERSRAAWCRAALAGAVALLVSSAGCDRKDAPAAPTTATAETTAARPDALRCQDFISKDEAKALGLRAELYNDRAKAQVGSVRCTLGEVSVQIWRGNQYTSAVNGIQANGARTGVATEDGPRIGAETQWTTMPDVHGMDGKSPHTVNFLPANQKFTAAVTGTDRAKVERVAGALLTKLEAM